MVDEDKEQNTLEKPRHFAKKKFCTCKMKSLKLTANLTQLMEIHLSRWYIQKNPKA